MRELAYDAAVIGGGAAGMAAALEIRAQGLSCVVLEREENLGGILLQCVHNGFGLIEFKEELSGPEFAERLEERFRASGADAFLGVTVMDVETQGDRKVLYGYSAVHGILRVSARAVVLAMGCRERNRGNIRIPGTRPSGVYTAGLAQRLVNMEGYLPGKDVVIIGSGDIGLIMARRMTWAGARVHGVVEILPYPSGLTRNIVQCLRDFGIPLYLSHLTTGIFGADRVESVEIAPIEDGAVRFEKSFRIPCDTVLLSVGLVPENELSKKMGVELNPMTNGPWTDSMMMTGVPGVFAAGNVLHVHDLVDYVAEEARRAGAACARWIKSDRPEREIRVKAGPNVRYTAPVRVGAGTPNKIYLRTLIVKNDAVLELRLNNRVVRSIRKQHIQPSEMICVAVEPSELEAAGPDSTLEIAIL